MEANTETTPTITELEEAEGPHNMTVVYTDGSCIRNGDDDAEAGSGIWFGSSDTRNAGAKVPGLKQSNQTGKIYAVQLAATTMMEGILHIKSDS